MTSYRELEDWEFKIMRSAIGAFKDPRVFQSTVQQESLGGWELMEKFDDERVRFRRPVSARNNDATLPRGYDPYRTQVGISEGALVLYIIFGILLVVGGIMGILAWYGLLD
jgi:hypothetical protein